MQGKRGTWKVLFMSAFKWKEGKDEQGQVLWGAISIEIECHSL